MQYIKFSFCLVFCLLISSIAFAQPGLETDEVEVIKNFEAQLSEATKLKVTPTLPALDTSMQVLNYSVPTQYLEVDYPAPTIKPIAMKSEKLPAAYDGYGKIGYGTPNSFYGDLSYHKMIKENLRIGAEAKHHSADNSGKNENQRFSTTGGALDGTYYFQEQGFAVGANVGFEQENRFFYGYDDAVATFEEDDVRQRFNTFDIGANFFNGERTNGDLNYFADIDFYRLTDKFATSENGTDMEVGVTKYFAEKHPLGLVLKTDFTSYKDNEARQQTLNNFSLHPSFGYHADRFKVDVGANVLSHNDEFTIYPDIEATVNILGTRLAAFAGWEGNFVKNTFQSLTDYNPFLMSSGFDLRNTEYQEYYGGIKGNINVVEYHGKIGLKNANNLALFVVNAMDSTRFDVLYDTTQVVNIEGTMNLNVLKGLQLGGTLRSNVFSPSFQEKAWGLPAFETNISARYRTLEDKLLIKVDWYTANGISYIRYDDNGDAFADNLNALFDVSLGAEYWIHQNFAAFLDVNNLFGNKRERWQNYPTYGLNLLVGLTGRF